MICRIAVALFVLGCGMPGFGQDSVLKTTAGAAAREHAPDTLDAVSIAMNMEKGSIEHYLSLEKTTPVKEYVKIYKLLVRDEQKHFQLLSSWQKELLFKADVSSDILERAKEMMAGFPIDTFSAEVAADTANSLEQVLRDDLEKERQSVALYQECMKKARSDGERAVFSFIAAEENKHIALLNSLIDYAKNPGGQLKAAEGKK